jgi:GxxExxY protein
LEFLDNSILYWRESEMPVHYKGNRLKHKFISDFVVFESIIVEIKSTDKGISDDYIAQTLNYLRVSDITVGLIINFGKRKLEFKRLIVK